MKSGQIQLYMGHSKGKTTAALGQVIRAYGRGLKCAIIYFDKGGFNYGERKVLTQLNIDFFVTGLNRIDENNKFRFGVIEDDIKEANRGLSLLSDLFKENYDLIVCDEINSTTNLGMLKEEDVLSVLKNKPENLELILTGRDAPESFINEASLVTEMKLHKHYYYDGVMAREGIEF
jgi:cob(I)alamin adenosyltransferase